MEGLNIHALGNLTPDKRLELEAQLMGYAKLPPTIREFINDPYYLGDIYGGGKLYEYWIPVLEDIYPDPITTRYNNIVLTGCLGSGKSTVSRVMALYTLCRLDHLKNFDFFKLAKGKNLVMSYFHTTNENVDNTFLSPLKVIKQDSPYFSGGLLHNPPIDHFGDTTRGKGPIGLDVLFYVFSEVNFIRPEQAKHKLDSAFNRFASRFKRVSDWFGNIIIDSSAAEGGSFVDEFIEKRCDPDKTKIVRSKIWEVKPTDYGHDGWFKVYLGDSSRDAFLMDGSQYNPNELDAEGNPYKDAFNIPEGLDPDRVLEVPMELYSEFNLNINLSLNDHAGVSTNSSNLFMTDRKKLAEAFTLPMLNPDVIELDFYDKSDRLIDHVRESVKAIPPEKVLSISFDIGVTADYCGIAIGYFDDYIIKDKKNKTRIPTYKIPVVIALSRMQGQETSISMLYEFVKDLSKTWEIGSVTADTYQSRQLLQDLERDNFNAYVISVDRTSDAYHAFKLAIYEERVKMPSSALLQREIRELKAVYKNGKMKVDHPETTKSDHITFGRGSKDTADAVCGALHAMAQDLEIFTNLSKHYIRNSYTKHMKKQVVSNKHNIKKDMMKITKTGGYERFRKRELERAKTLANDRVGEIRTNVRVSKRDRDEGYI